MKNCKKHFIVALIVLAIGQFLAPMTARAQVVEVGGNVGLSYYMGDLNPNKPFVQSDFGWGLLVRYYENTRWAFRFSYSNLKLNGSDNASGYRPERGLSFHSKVNDFAVIAEFNFFDYFTGSKRNGLSPYIFAGVSIFTFNPKADDGTELHDQFTDVIYATAVDSLGTEYEYQKKTDYNTIAVSIPFGVGVKYSISSRLGMTIEWRWDYTFTDWIDDCHGYYPTFGPEKVLDDHGHWTGEYETPAYVQYSDPTGFATEPDPFNPGLSMNDKSYIQRGNKDDNDWFGYLSVSITYKFNLPNGNGCNKRERYKNFD